MSHKFPTIKVQCSVDVTNQPKSPSKQQQNSRARTARLKAVRNEKKIKLVAEQKIEIFLSSLAAIGVKTPTKYRKKSLSLLIKFERSFAVTFELLIVKSHRETGNHLCKL